MLGVEVDEEGEQEVLQRPGHIHGGQHRQEEQPDCPSRQVGYCTAKDSVEDEVICDLDEEGAEQAEAKVVEQGPISILVGICGVGGYEVE